jgi:hypothetical protein
MNAIAIILGIVIIILFFVLYKYFTTTASKLNKTTNVSLNTNLTENSITKIDSPTNTQYAFGIWIYIVSWNYSTPKTIFNFNGAMKVYIDSKSPSLKVDINTTDKTKSPATTTITENFPLQKWVFIIVSMDNSYLDVYLDGKLIKSVLITNPSQPPSTTNIVLGNSNTPFQPFNANVANFYRWTIPMDPGTAWNYYMKGNGQGGLMSSMSAYGLNMQVLQNNVETASYQLL